MKAPRGTGPNPLPARSRNGNRSLSDLEFPLDFNSPARGRFSHGWIPRAAAMPSATASTTSLPPFTQSPPAKYFGLRSDVARLRPWCRFRAFRFPSPRAKFRHRLLPDGTDHHVHFDREIAIGDDSGIAAFSPSSSAACARIRGLRRRQFRREMRTGCVCHRKFTPSFCQLVFVTERRHFVFAAAIDQMHGIGAEAFAQP